MRPENPKRAQASSSASDMRLRPRIASSISPQTVLSPGCCCDPAKSVPIYDTLKASRILPFLFLRPFAVSPFCEPCA